MSNTAALFAQAWQYHQAKDYGRAEGLYRHILQTDPSHADAWCFLGAVCQAQGNSAEAERCYRRALELVPGFASAHNCLGILLAEQGRYEEAAASFDQLLRLQPQDADACNNLGLVRARQGRLDEAVASYQRALQLRPAFPAAQANLDQTLRQRADWPSSPLAVRSSVGAAQTADGLPEPGQPCYYIVMPWSKSHGWGICGKYITRELSRLTRIRYVPDRLDRSQAASELEYRFFAEKLATQQEIEFLERANDRYPVLQTIVDHRLTPWFRQVRAPYKVGYTFFEELAGEADVKTARSYFDLIIAGSSWCAGLLHAKGYPQAPTVLQGIDPLMFHPGFADKEMFQDRFVVFSGGKFEYRKGQDLVIRAFKVLQDRHADVLLITSWFNHWPFSMQTMAASPHICYSYRAGDYVTNMNQALRENGIDLDRVLTLPLCPNEIMARIYQNTDVGLFPNRCEGGTNLVLMEYMACGKPVIASYSSGHKDIVSSDNAILIENLRPLTLYRNSQPYAVWDDPDLEETIHHLERAYQNRDDLKRLGQRAGKDLANFTWRKTAESFYRLLSQARK